jgi:4-hydroxybutyryl-CoA dehydratase/vinylacetyl-CoA-Delta-isomerase
MRSPSGRVGTGLGTLLPRQDRRACGCDGLVGVGGIGPDAEVCRDRGSVVAGDELYGAGFARPSARLTPGPRQCRRCREGRLVHAPAWLGARNVAHANDSSQGRGGGVTAVDTKAPLSPVLRTPHEYRESLRDDRRIFYRGVAVDDVTEHPVFSLAVNHASLDFAMAHDDAYAGIAVAPEGYSRYFHVPQGAEDLLARSHLIEASTRAGKTLVLLIKEIGSDALLALLGLSAELGEPYASRIESFYRHCRDGDLAVCVAQTDVKGDRALGPSEQPNPEAYLKIVGRRSDGIIVRGAKIHTSVSVNANEMIVLPTRAMSEADSDYAVAFAIPIDTPGLILVASPYLSTHGKNEAEHPLSATRKMVETTTLFDDVFVPFDRVFMDGRYELAGTLARAFVEFHRFTAISYKLPLVDALVGAGLLAARVNGLERAGHVRDKLSWLISYAETLRALTHHAAERCTVVDGVAVPDTLLVNVAKLQFAQGLHTALMHVQDIAGGLLATYPAVEDLDNPVYGEALARYLESAGGVSGRDRLRVMNMISDLTTGEYGGYQAVLAIHAEGSIEAEKLTILARYDHGAGIAYAKWLAGLDDSPWPPN